ncbi:sodium/hydrogen exchanger 1 isoform X2 [Lepeophtheirus salmonis]
MGAVVNQINNVCEDSSCISTVFNFPTFSPSLFFYFLLPPIVLDAAYSLHDPAFFDNLSSIVIYALLGTAFNFLAIGGSLYLVYYCGGFNTDLGVVEVMVFASLISAVDPVAVLAIFQEVGVNSDLYFLLFGESLLNDGVAVVFYKLMNTFAEMQHAGIPITLMDFGLGVISFLSVAFGGLMIGILVGFLSALITKCTSDVRVVEPLAVFGMAYLSYITAELFHWSGIISLIGCGLIQAHYSFKNISEKSYITVKYFIKMSSATSDVIIFLFLGIALIKGPYAWETRFVLWTLIFCLLFRFTGVYVLTWILNRRRVRKVNLQEQFIMAYGGLRGAVGFCLVNMISEDIIKQKQMFVTTTLAVVTFTIFIQGGTIKALVNLLNIDKRKEDTKRLLSEEVNTSIMENIMAGIEIISGKHGQQWFWKMIGHYDDVYLMKWFCKRNQQAGITMVYEKLALSDHLCNLYGPATLLEEGKTKELIESLSLHKDQYMLDEHTNDDRNLRPKQHLKRKRSSSITNNVRFNVQRESLYRGSDLSDTELGKSFNKVERSSSKMEDIERLRSAVLSNPYRRLHQKYNRNLIGDDDQELEVHLRKRRINARRMSLFALSNDQGTSSSFLISSPRTPKNSPNNIENRKALHLSLIGKSFDRSDSMDSNQGDSVYNTISYPNTNVYPGLDALIRRQNQRVRSMSISSNGPPDPLSPGRVSIISNTQVPKPSQTKDLSILNEVAEHEIQKRS